jgi:nickel-dependent lactate racemase
MAESQELFVGLSPWSFTLRSDQHVELHREALPQSTASPGDLLHAALEHPFKFEPLRRALAPEDRVTLVVDTELPHLTELVTKLLTYLKASLIPPELVTILTTTDWAADLPSEFASVQREVHDPTDRNKLAYLASTRDGRRIYLNRTLVDADAVIVLSGRGYDPLAGYAGAEAAIFPALGDTENLHAFQGQVSIDAPGERPWPVRVEAAEVVRMLGMPFLVQVIEGPSGSVQQVVAGLVESSGEGVSRQDSQWAATVAEEPDTVVAAIGGEPERITFMDLAKAAICAARVAPRGARIAILTTAAPTLGEGAEMLRTMDSPAGAKQRLAKLKPVDWSACRLWGFAVRKYSVFLVSGYSDETAEELFATPIHTPSEVQRLIDSGGKVLLIPDAHKMMVTTE